MPHHLFAARLAVTGALAASAGQATCRSAIERRGHHRARLHRSRAPRSVSTGRSPVKTHISLGRAVESTICEIAAFYAQARETTRSMSNNRLPLAVPDGAVRTMEDLRQGPHHAQDVLGCGGGGTATPTGTGGEDGNAR